MVVLQNCRLAVSVSETIKLPLSHQLENIPRDLYKYLPEPHASNFAAGRSVRVRSLRAFREIEEVGLARHDAEEGQSFDSITEASFAPGAARPHAIERIFGRDGHVEANSIDVGYEISDGLIFCMSCRPSLELCRAFRDQNNLSTHARCVRISDRLGFLTALDEAVRNRFPNAGAPLALPCVYRIVPVEWRQEVQAIHPAFVKDEKYIHEAEVRVFWAIDGMPIDHGPVDVPIKATNAAYPMLKEELRRRESHTIVSVPYRDRTGAIVSKRIDI